jgi:hypothetical protein
MKKKKILHIAESFAGGVFNFLADLVPECTDKFQVYIAFGKRPDTPENYKDYFPKSVHFIEVNNFCRSVNFAKDFKAYKEVKRIVCDVDPEIVHLHSSKAGLIGRLAVNCRKRKVLYNPHGFSFLMMDSSKAKRLLYRFIEKCATIKPATIVGVSQGEYQEAIKLSKKSVLINNGLNIENITELTKDLVPHKLNPKNPKVCTLARVVYQKNPEMFNEVAKSFPTLKFVWIGDGELKDKLTSPNIVVTGWKSKKEAMEIINDCDLFLLTSLWEGLPLSLLEAMFMKKIPIVSNCMGNKDVVNKKNGFVCNNLQEYKSAVNAVLNSTMEELESVGAFAKEDVIKNYNLKNNVKEKYIPLYNKM